LFRAEHGRAKRAKQMKERPMRWGFCIAMVIGMASPAFAADYDVLRGSVPVVPIAPVTTVGPATFTRWSGFYFGGDFSFNYGQADFSTATQPLVGLALQDTVVQQQFQPSQLQALGNGANSAFGFGGFLGYNTQWQDLWRRSLGIAFVSEFLAACRDCERALCTPTSTQTG
jgi:hypothetical protein